MDQKRLGGIIGIIALAVLVGWVTLSQSGIEYRARPNGETTTTSISTGYDEYDRALDQISVDLENANRNEGTRLMGKRYLGTDARQCDALEYVCEVGERKFTDPYGCGCMPDERYASSTAEELASTEPIQQEVSLGEEFRLRLDEEVAIGGGGDALWIEEFRETDTAPEVVYKIYIAVEDKAYDYPAEKDAILYALEEVASDYQSYVDVIIRNRLVAPSTGDSEAQEG